MLPLDDKNVKCCARKRSRDLNRLKKPADGWSYTVGASDPGHILPPQCPLRLGPLRVARRVSRCGSVVRQQVEPGASLQPGLFTASLRLSKDSRTSVAAPIEPSSVHAARRERQGHIALRVERNQAALAA